MEQTKNMVRIVCDALTEKKGEDIRVIDISGVSVIADYFIIANGSNTSQISALVDSVEGQMEKAGYPLKQREGHGSGTWELLDFHDVIVHIFDKENRLFYNLERIWSDGVEISMDDVTQ